MVIGKSKLWILSVLTIANFIVFLDASILPVALPTIQHLLHSSNIQLQWMINSYLLSLSIFVAIAGKFADILGHRKIFSIGMVLFGISSLLCGLSETSAQLIITRFFQGIGSAMMAPTATAILFETFSENQRPKIMGIITAFNSIGFAFGPLVGGFFTQYLSWHYIFFINIPIVLVGLIITLKFISKSPRIKEKIDILGFISFGIGITCLTLVLMQGKTWGWNSVPIVFLSIISGAFFLVLYFSSKKIKLPFINFSFFKNLSFLCLLIVIFTTSIARMMTVYWVIFFQNILNLTPFNAGALTMISSIPMIFYSPYAGKFIAKYGPKPSVVLGQIIVILAFIWLIIFMSKGNVVFISIALLAFGMGIILTMISAFNTAMGSVLENRRGIASGILNTFRNVGNSLGVAILSSVFLHMQFNKFTSILSKSKDTEKLNPNIFEGLLSKTTKAINALKELPTNIQVEIKKAMQSSYDYGITFANFIAAVVVAIGLLTILLYFKPKKRKTEEQFTSIEP